MQLFAAKAPELAATAVDRLELGSERGGLTHILITCCTGFTAPGLDLELVERCQLPPSIERTIVGFMGCYAAINALKLARHIVRSNPKARILIVNFELCTLHLQDTSDLAKLLTFLLWGDGCAASLVSSEPHGLSLDSFRAVHFPDTAEFMRWNIGDSGFDMVLSGKVPTAIEQGIRNHGNEILEGADPNAIELWAVHPGGRTVVDAVERAFAIAPAALSASRGVLRDFGNMSSASIMFVLKRLLDAGRRNAAGLRHGVRARSHRRDDVVSNRPCRLSEGAWVTMTFPRRLETELLDVLPADDPAAMRSRRDLRLPECR